MSQDEGGEVASKKPRGKWVKKQRQGALEALQENEQKLLLKQELLLLEVR